jgi:hypothetical protein
MDFWREKAAEFLPEFIEQITSAESPMALWIEISFELEKAYEAETANEDLVSRIYRYAFWCLDQPQTDSAESDLSTAVAVAFIENIPLNPKTAADLHNHLSIEEFDGFGPLFRYHLDENQFAAFRREFAARKNNSA